MTDMRLFLYREPAENLADNLLRDFETMWWNACREVGSNAHPISHFAAQLLTCMFDSVVAYAQKFAFILHAKVLR